MGWDGLEKSASFVWLADLVLYKVYFLPSFLEPFPGEELLSCIGSGLRASLLESRGWASTRRGLHHK